MIFSTKFNVEYDTCIYRQLLYPPLERSWSWHNIHVNVKDESTPYQIVHGTTLIVQSSNATIHQITLSEYSRAWWRAPCSAFDGRHNEPCTSMALHSPSVTASSSESGRDVTWPWESRTGLELSAPLFENVFSTKKLTVPYWILYPSSMSWNLLGHSVLGLAVIVIVVGLLLLWHSSGTFCVMWRKRYVKKCYVSKTGSICVQKWGKKLYSKGTLRQNLSLSDGATCTWRRRKNQIPKRSGSRTLCCLQTIGETQNWSAIVSLISSNVCLLMDRKSLTCFGCLMPLIYHVWSSHARF